MHTSYLLSHEVLHTSLQSLVVVALTSQQTQQRPGRLHHATAILTKALHTQRVHN